MSKLVARLGVPALAVLALAGCGSSSSSSTTSSSTTSTSASSGANASIAAQVPAAIKSKGTLTVAADATYAPNEFIASDGHTVIGMDADLLKALGEVMGLKVKLVNATFDNDHPGPRRPASTTSGHRLSPTPRNARRQSTSSTTSTPASPSMPRPRRNPSVSTVADLCGKTVSVEKGTTEQEESEAQSKKCTKEGKKAVTVLSFPDQNGANLAISSGRAELGMADSPVAAYQVKQSAGAFKEVGEPYGIAPYGLAIPKANGMTKPVSEALKVLIENGTYKKILEKWGVQAGAISEPKINGAIS